MSKAHDEELGAFCNCPKCSIGGFLRIIYPKDFKIKENKMAISIMSEIEVTEDTYKQIALQLGLRYYSDSIVVPNSVRIKKIKSSPKTMTRERANEIAGEKYVRMLEELELIKFEEEKKNFNIDREKEYTFTIDTFDGYRVVTGKLLKCAT